MAVGTIEYMAPEQILNSRNVTPGSDIYAAGAILFRACAGRHVFGDVASDAELAQKKLTTESPAAAAHPQRQGCAEGLAKVVGKMLKRRPSERYKSADEVLADLLPLARRARPRRRDGGPHPRREAGHPGGRDGRRKRTCRSRCCRRGPRVRPGAGARVRPCAGLRACAGLGSRAGLPSHAGVRSRGRSRRCGRRGARSRCAAVAAAAEPQPVTMGETPKPPAQPVWAQRRRRRAATAG